MKVTLIKAFKTLKPGVHDLPDNMVARLKKYGYVEQPKQAVKEEKVQEVIEVKPKAKTKAKKKTKELKAAYETKDE